MLWFSLRPSRGSRSTDWGPRSDSGCLLLRLERGGLELGGLERGGLERGGLERGGLLWLERGGLLPILGGGLLPNLGGGLLPNLGGGGSLAGPGASRSRDETGKLSLGGVLLFFVLGLHVTSKRCGIWSCVAAFGALFRHKVLNYFCNLALESNKSIVC